MAAALVARAAQALAPLAGELRRYPAQHVHLTLAFLGETPEARLGELETALAGAARGALAPELVVRGTGGFPKASRARVLWAGLDEAAGSEGRLTELQRRVVEALAGAGFELADAHRAFTPHLTLARPKGRGPLAAPPGFVALDFRSAAGAELGWSATALALFESRPGQPGAERYPVLGRHALA